MTSIILNKDIYLYIINLLWNEKDIKKKWLISLDLVCWDFHNIVKSLNNTFTLSYSSAKFNMKHYLMNHYDNRYCPISTEPNAFIINNCSGLKISANQLNKFRMFTSKLEHFKGGSYLYQQIVKDRVESSLIKSVTLIIEKSNDIDDEEDDQITSNQDDEIEYLSFLINKTNKKQKAFDMEMSNMQQDDTTDSQEQSATAEFTQEQIQEFERYQYSPQDDEDRYEDWKHLIDTMQLLSLHANCNKIESVSLSIDFGDYDHFNKYALILSYLFSTGFSGIRSLSLGGQSSETLPTCFIAYPDALLIGLQRLKNLDQLTLRFNMAGLSFEPDQYFIELKNYLSAPENQLTCLSMDYPIRTEIDQEFLDYLLSEECKLLKIDFLWISLNACKPLLPSNRNNHQLMFDTVRISIKDFNIVDKELANNIYKSLNCVNKLQLYAHDTNYEPMIDILSNNHNTKSLTIKIADEIDKKTLESIFLAIQNNCSTQLSQFTFDMADGILLDSHLHQNNIRKKIDIILSSLTNIKNPTILGLDSCESEMEINF